MARTSTEMQQAQRETLREWQQARTHRWATDLLVAWTPTRELWEDYARWCRNRQRVPISAQTWLRTLEDQPLPVKERTVLRTKCLPLALVLDV